MAYAISENDKSRVEFSPVILQAHIDVTQEIEHSGAQVLSLDGIRLPKDVSIQKILLSIYGSLVSSGGPVTPITVEYYHIDNTTYSDHSVLYLNFTANTIGAAAFIGQLVLFE